MGNKNAKGVRREESLRKHKAKGSGSDAPGQSRRQGNVPQRRSEVARLSESENICLDDFTLLTVVGKGSFGKVIQVRKNDSGEIFAMKVLKKDHVVKRKQVEHTMTERRILENIRHPFIVSLRYAFQTSQKLYMVFDYFNGGELFHYLSTQGRFAPDRARFYGAEITLAIEHLHSLNIVYRDLKPENLLLDSEGHIKVADFGLSKENVTENDVKSFCGTPEYLAPEVIQRQTYGKAVDWWSFGTLLYEFITGLPPYYDRNRQDMYKKILRAPLKFPGFVDDDARDLLTQLLKRDPEERAGFESTDVIKNHAYYASIDWGKLYNKELDPPFKPRVRGDSDVSNVDAAFRNMPAAVTPTPAGAKLLAQTVEEDEKNAANFGGFTFVTENVLDGVRYSVSFDDLDHEFDFPQEDTNR
jgi:serine/threonine protein kinase